MDNQIVLKRETERAVVLRDSCLAWINNGVLDSKKISETFKRLERVEAKDGK